MRKICYILKKELLLLFRDVPGLIILFLMPVLLIFVVTIAQENALKNQSAGTKVLCVDESGNQFAQQVFKNFDSSGFIDPVTMIDDLKVTRKIAENLIREGVYKFGVIISGDHEPILIIADPALLPSFRSSVTNSLIYIIKGTQTKVAMDGILSTLQANMQPVVTEMIGKRLKEMPPILESYAQKDRSVVQPNVIQNNVPGFILFAMFFIVIPLSGSLITEKKEGSYQRLRSLPVSLSVILGGKVLIYTFVCLLQFLLMMILGIWAFPTFFEMPGLVLGNQYLSIAVATLAASLAAVGFGILVGAAATSHNQAALFGSVMVVMLGVISGTFLPVHLMPAPVQLISNISPVRWGIDNYLDLFVRDGNLLTILPKTVMLVLFFGLAMIISIAIFAKQK